MRIAINATYRLHGGGLVHLRNLLESWARTGVDQEHTILLFSRPENWADLQPVISDRVEIQLLGRISGSPASKVLWEQYALPGILAKFHPDVLFCPGGVIPLRSPVPTVAVFQNAGPFCAGVTPCTAGAYDWAWFKMLGVFMRLAMCAARRVVFVSQYLKDVFVQRYRFPDERGDVIYHGRDVLSLAHLSGDLLNQLHIRSPYCLSASHLYPYKNIPALIEGYALARQVLQARELQLALVGKPRNGKYLRHLTSLIRRHGLEESIVLTGDVPRNTVGSLLLGCEFFVFQSLCESISLVLIEALTAGVPIACANASVMPETAGNAALYFKPFDAADIAGALTRMAEDAVLRAELRHKARQQALKFPTWDEVGRLTLQSLERAATGD